MRSKLNRRRWLRAAGTCVALGALASPFGCSLPSESERDDPDRGGTGSAGASASGTAGAISAGSAGYAAGSGGAAGTGFTGAGTGGVASAAGAASGAGGIVASGSGGIANAGQAGAGAVTSGGGGTLGGTSATGGALSGSAGLPPGGAGGVGGEPGCGELTLCDGVCVSLATDSAHCGACTTACAADRRCEEGHCACSVGTECGASCVDLSADPENCGVCGEECGEGELCSIPAGETSARCVLACASGQTQCGQSCVDPATSRDHCGGCEMPCPTAQICADRSCVCAGGSEELCAELCVNTQTSAAHCGACNAACAAPRTCSAGTCNCSGGQSYCSASNTCVNLQTDPNNCGTCGNRCMGSATCTNGTCMTQTTSCEIGPSHDGDGSFTYYYFGQGTGPDGSGYRTACGYYGTESGTTDTVENLANTSPASNTYFAAIPGDGSFSSSVYCGACVEITGQNGTKIIATVIDNCPTSSNEPCRQRPNQHLDLSKAAFDRLGYSVGNPMNTSWRFVACPVSGNVKVRFKTGNDNEFFVENGITAIASATVNGTPATRTTYGAWHVNSRITTPATLGLTDKAGRSITVTLNAGTQNQDTGVQFPACN